MMPSDKPDAHIVCAILSAQALALRDQIETVTVVQATGLDGAAELVTRAADGIRALAREPKASQAALGPLLAAVGEAGQALDSLAFAQAQRQDLLRQLADCLGVALRRLACGVSGLSAEGLAELYVSEDQRRVHADVIGQWDAALIELARHPEAKASA